VNKKKAQKLYPDGGYRVVKKETGKNLKRNGHTVPEGKNREGKNDWGKSDTVSPKAKKASCSSV